MCGIAGIISPDTDNIYHHKLEQMGQSLLHRGPDGYGSWISNSGTAGFAHRRLAIIDLTNGGAQPMHFEHLTIVYNGEIYNYPEIRDQLKAKGYRFNTQSDTEVLLLAYHCYGEQCLELLDGMFAFAIWDDNKGELFAARDRFGEKPFYYHYNKRERSIYFASEIKALTAIGVGGEEDNQVLLYYLCTGLSRPAHHRGRTFFKSILYLPPAHFLRFRPRDNHIERKGYWSFEPRTEPISATAALEKFEQLLYTSVKRRLRSDVSTGTNLSGGLDSSAIASTISGVADRGSPYQSFSVKFPGFDKDESVYIDEVCRLLALTNHSITPDADQLAQTLQDLCYFQEEPFNSASVFLQYQLAGLARSHNVKVLLDGQGADETLAGYQHQLHWYLQELLRQGKWNDFRRQKAMLQSSPLQLNWSYRNYLAAWLPGKANKALEKRQKQLFQNNPDLNPEFTLANYSSDLVQKPVLKTLNDVLWHHTTQGALEELLRYADKNTMSHGVELRLPFLYHELVEFVFSLPAELKIKDGYTKWILRDSMKEKLPASVVWRKDKIGFEPPQRAWMQEQPLQELIYQSRKKLAAAGILRKELVNQPVHPSSAYSEQNTDWRYLIAGMFI